MKKARPGRRKPKPVAKRRRAASAEALSPSRSARAAPPVESPDEEAAFGSGPTGLEYVRPEHTEPAYIGRIAADPLISRLPKPKWDKDRPMKRWLNAMLDADNDPDQHLNIATTTDGRRIHPTTTPDEAIIARALELDYEPLAALLESEVELSPAMRKWMAQHLRSGGFAARKKKPGRLEVARRERWAADDAERIKSLWHQHYGRVNRAKGLKSAAAFAAERWKVPLPSLVKLLRKRAASRRPRRSPPLF